MAEKEKTTSFELSCVVDGQVCYVEMVEKGKRLSSLPKPTKEFHTFTGWEKVPSRMPARNLVVEGHFVPNTYKLTFRAGEDIISEMELPYGAAVEYPADPVKEGLTFEGWDAVHETMPGADTVVEGKFTPNTYTITYTITDATGKMGKTSFTYPCLFGDPIPEMDMPQKDYYTFSGWSDAPEFMPAHDIELQGTLALTLYKLTRIVDGVIFKEELLPFGAPISKKPNPTKEGHYFSGFRSLPKTMPDHDVEVISSMYPARYKADFMLNGELYKSLYIPFGAIIDETPEPREGYCFMGWEDCPETMPAHDIEVHGTMVRTEYRLVYRVRGKEIHTDLYYAGDVVTPTPPFVLDGFRFEGWKNVPDVMPEHDVYVDGDYTLTASHVAFVIDGVEYATLDTAQDEFVEPTPETRDGYSFEGWTDTAMGEDGVLRVSGAYRPNTYTATFVLDGDVIAADSYAYGAAITAPEAPLKDNLTFLGWKNLPDVMPDHDIRVEGTYAETLYRIEFVADGTIVAEYARQSGAEITPPDAPEKEGYTFGGWMDPPSTMPAYDLTVNGVYNINSYTVTYQLNGDTFATDTVEYGDTIVAPTPEAKDGMTFAGWENLPATMPAHDIVVEGSMGNHDYYVSFVVDGQVTSRVRCAEGMMPETPAEAPEKEGHTFAGWANLPEAMPASDVTVTATFETNTYNLSFEVNGEVVRTVSLAYGAAVEMPEDLAKLDDPAFAGWGTMPETMPAGDVTVVASMERKPYALRYHMDGELFWQANLYPGDPVTRPEVPEKEGHSFAGWKGFVATMPDADVDVTGFYIPNSHKVTYLSEGEVVALGNALYGTAPVAPVVPTKEGHTFVSWAGLPEAMPDYDVSVEAVYEEGEEALDVAAAPTEGYLYRFEASGEVVATIRVPEGTAPAIPAAPYKYGFTFTKWDDIPEQAEKDEVLVAHYKPNTHHILYLCDDILVYDQSANYGDPVITPADLVVPGVEKWDGLPSVMPDHDVIVKAVATKLTVEITCHFGEDNTEVLEFARGAVVTLPEIPAKEGYDVLGWQEDVPELATEDMVFHANYKAHVHTVCFMCCGEEVASLAFAYGEKIEAPELFRELGDIIYDSWDSIPDAMPDEDITIHAAGRHAGGILIFMVEEDEVLRVHATEGVDFPKEECPEAPELEGRDYIGWDLPSPVPAGESIVKALYNPRMYHITYRVKGMPYKTVEIPYGTTVEPIKAPVVKKRLFVGWNSLPHTMPAEDLTIDALYVTQNSFLLSFQVDGQPYAESVLETGTRILMPKMPEKEGYVFSGWDKNVTVIGREPIIVNGSYRPLAYKLTYFVEGEEYATYSVNVGDRLPCPDAPQTDRTFTGWTTLPAHMPAHDLTAEANIGVDYTVTFMADGVKLSEFIVPEKSPITIPEAPEKEGFTFEGWDHLTEVADADLVCTAKYTPNAYTVTFMFEDAVYAEKQVTFGHAVDLPDAPEKEGYTLAAWENLPETMPAHDVTVVAVMEEVPEEPTPVEEAPAEDIVVELDAAPAVEVPVEEPEAPAEEEPATEDIAAQVDAAPELEEVPEEPAEAPAEETEEVVAAASDVDVTLVSAETEEVVEEVEETPAEELPVLYTVLYRAEDDDYATYQLLEGEEIPTPDEPKTQNAFRGWAEHPATMPAENLVIEAVVGYYVTFVCEEQTLETVLVKQGEPIPTPAEVPAKEGHTFGGWNGLVDTTECDITCTALYVPNTHIVTYKIGDETVYTGELAFGEALPAVEAPADHPLFDGWMDMPATMPDEDVVVCAQLKVVEEAVEAEAVAAEVEEVPEVAEEQPEEEPVAEEQAPALYTLTFVCGEEVWAEAKFAEGEAILLPHAPEMLGDRFDGWMDLPEVMPAGDLTIHAKLKEALTTVRFVIDEELVSEIQIAPTAKAEPPVAADREGYDFSGWSEIPLETPEGVLVYQGHYVPHTHTVTFMVGKKIYATAEVPFGTEIPCPEEEPTKSNQTFFGWRDIPATMPDEDLKLQAIFEARFVVTYLIDDKVFHEDILAPKSKITPPEVPDQYGYTFSGWSEYPKKMRHEPITVKGSYIPLVHTVTYKDGDVAVHTEEVAYKCQIPLVDAPAKVGHKFVNWGTEFDLMPNQDIELVAVYEPKSYKIVFKLDDGIIVSEEELPYGTPVVAPEMQEKAGYVFAGWENLPETMPAYMLVVTGKYEVCIRTLTYLVYGKEYAQQSYYMGDHIELIDDIPKAKKHSQMFSHWDNLPMTMGTEDVVVTAVFDSAKNMHKKKKKVTCMVDKKIYKSFLVLPGRRIPTPDVPYKLGCELVEWQNKPEIMPDHDITITAVFARRDYKATFYVDGTPFYTASLPFGTAMPMPVPHPKEGMTFDGWDNYSNRMPNYDFDLHARFKRNKYTIFYKADGKVIHSAEYVWGESIKVFIPRNSKTGIFDGWQGLPATMPMRNIEVQAIYRPRPYKVTYVIDENIITDSMIVSGDVIIPPSVAPRGSKVIVSWTNMPDDSIMPAQDIVLEAVWGYAPRRKRGKKADKKNRKASKLARKQEKKDAKQAKADQRACGREEARRMMRRLMR